MMFQMISHFNDIVITLLQFDYSFELYKKMQEKRGKVPAKETSIFINSYYAEKL